MMTRKLSLVSSPSWSQSRVIPFAFTELAAYALTKGVDTAIIDVKRSPYKRLSANDKANVLSEIISKVIKTNPSYIGLSCFTSNYQECCDLASRIKDKIKAVIIVGGIHPTICYQDFFYKNSPFDFAVIGEGEDALCEIVQAQELGTDYCDIKGIAFRRDDRLVRTEIRPCFKDLSHLPSPAYEMVDMDFYLQPQRGIIRSLVTSGLHILTGRGCPFSCTFCANKAIFESQGLSPLVRHRSVEAIINNLKHLKTDYGLESFYIADDTFTLPASRAKDFCQMYKASGLTMPWAAETRVNLIDESMVLALKTAGCVQLDFGVESGSQEALDRMRKGTTVSDIRKAFLLSKRYKLRTFANIMFNTPKETEKDVTLTINLMKELKADHYGIALTVPLPGSQLFDEYLGDRRLSKEDYWLFSAPGLFQRIIDPRLRLAAHSLDLDRLYLKINLRFFF